MIGTNGINDFTKISGFKRSTSTISIRNIRFVSDNSSIRYCKSNGDSVKEYRIRLCEPCTITIEVLVPYESSLFSYVMHRLDGFDNRGIETQIWTNLCDKYSSTGRWHAIPSCRTEIRRELRGRVHSFSVSVIPIRCGTFEFTARTRAPKSGNNEWIWASKFEMNEKVNVIRTGTQRNGFSQGSVRQLAIWFDDILMYWQLKDTEHPSATHHRNLLTAYTAVFLAVIALQQGIKV